MKYGDDSEKSGRSSDLFSKSRFIVRDFSQFVSQLTNFPENCVQSKASCQCHLIFEHPCNHSHFVKAVIWLKITVNKTLIKSLLANNVKERTVKVSHCSSDKK